MTKASPLINKYFKQINKSVEKAYEIAGKARQKGLDPEKEVPIPIARNMAERVVGLISVVCPKLIGSKVTDRIIELEKEFGLLDWRVGFKIAEEVAKEQFFKFDDKIEALEIGIRVGFAYLTLGIVSAPLEGFIGLKIKKRKDGKEYFALQYAGPIRAAGGTAASTSVILCDYVRVKCGYAPWDPDEKEVNRYITDVSDYHDRVTNLQYRPSDEELKFLVSHLPVEVDGDPTEKFEVSNYKDLPRIETNLIRGGVALVLAEGLAQKAPKLWKRLSKWGKDFDLEWEWMGDFLKLKTEIHARHGVKKEEKKEEKKTVKANNTFVMDCVAGRPIITHPIATGGYRLRYGRSRMTGFSTSANHPATMQVLDKFVAVGTQLKTERPGKGTTVTVCDSIDGPIVRLKDGSVIQLNSEDEAKQVQKEISEILFLGDILINYGDFSENGHSLVPAGYCPEWWAREVERVTDEYKEFTDNPIENIPIFSQAFEIAKKTKTPLHANYTYFWKLVKGEDVEKLLFWLQQGKVKIENDEVVKIVVPLYEENHKVAKKVLEFIGMPHQVVNNEQVVIVKDQAKVLALCLGFTCKDDLNDVVLPNTENKDGLEIINQICPIKQRDKAGTFIGARMGRPEKAKMRQLTGSPQVMFPVGEEGDRLRSFQAALKIGKITGDFPLYYCNKCENETIYPSCEKCSQECVKHYYCRECGDLGENEKCKCGKAVQFKRREIDINYYFNKSKEIIGEKLHPDLIKGVRGTSNKDHVIEHLAKGILRAKHNIYVNKDGTTRYDGTELPCTGFKPKEIHTSVEKLKQLGYTYDIYGNELVNDNQVLEMKPQDVILPGFDSLDESAPKVLTKVATFIDELLKKFYKLKPYYNVKTPEDLAGHLVIGLAPHISAGIVGRIIGYSETQGLITHPMYHAAMRRDCVHPKTRFVYCKEEETIVEEIGSYVENLIEKGAKTKVVDQSGTKQVAIKEKLYAYGVDPKTKKQVKRRIKYFIKGPKPKNWIKVTTATNREILMTPTHDFMYVDNNEFEFKKANKIEVGDKVPILNKFETDQRENDYFDLIKLFVETVPDKNLENIFIINEEFFSKLIKTNLTKVKKCIKSKYYKEKIYEWKKAVSLSDLKRLVLNKVIKINEIPESKLRIKFSKKVHSSKLIMDNNLLNLLGYYSAEGCCRKNSSVSQISYRILDKKIQDHIVYLINEVFGIKPDLSENNSKITICDQLVYLLFKYGFNLGCSAYEKKVPNFIYSLPDDLVSSYISSFIDGGGSIIGKINRVIMYSVSREFLDGISLLLSKIGIFSRFQTTKSRLFGKSVLKKYEKLGKGPVEHVLHHLVINGPDIKVIKEFLKLNSVKANKLEKLKEFAVSKTYFNKKQFLLEKQGDLIIDAVKKVELIESDEHSYCFEIEWKDKKERNVLWGEQIINTRCDGDEAAVLLLMDALLNFSRQYLPERRGAKTMDAPLVLTTILNPAEVDDQVHGIDVEWKYPLEFYKAALEMKNPWEVRFGPDNKKIEQLSDRLGTELQYENFGFTHKVTNFNKGVLCSAYKILPSMAEKLDGQMGIAKKVRAVDMDEVAKLVIQKHFLRDIKGNFKKFSMQRFRCVTCNTKYRRPPLSSKCTAWDGKKVCGGKILFTITEGSVVKYLGPSLTLAEKYEFSPYLKQTLNMIRDNVDALFGKEKDKQVGLGDFMK